MKKERVTTEHAYVVGLRLAPLGELLPLQRYV